MDRPLCLHTYAHGGTPTVGCALPTRNPTGLYPDRGRAGRCSGVRWSATRDRRWRSTTVHALQLGKPYADGLIPPRG